MLVSPAPVQSPQLFPAIAQQVSMSLRRRLARPQRHRLLQGYPMAPLLRSEPPSFEPFAGLDLDASRPMLVGVLPHTFCNPRVRGCGFCTFPHERLDQPSLRRTVDHVTGEVRSVLDACPSLRGRKVPAVYLGGGTANLTPPEELRKIAEALTGSFDLREAEVTLEGVPRYFLLREEALLDVLSAMDVGSRRISMGVQSFDPSWIRRMGREHFGDLEVISAAQKAAHRRGFATSADLLINLPGAPSDLALSDVRTAMGLGFDQICVYNLVLTEDLDTEWAHDKSLLVRAASNEQAHKTWRAVRRTLLAAGYVQTTLTNFERGDLPQARRFRYELLSFRPDLVDGLGFGPGALSTFTFRGQKRARKWMNEAFSADYVAKLDRGESAAARSFDYAEVDLKLLFLTRGFSKRAVDGAAYREFFGTFPWEDFADVFSVLEREGLVRRKGDQLALTPEGMFFADAVAGLLAENRVRQIAPGWERRPVHDPMG